MRDRADWRLSGPTLLLDLEREVHQRHRLLRGSGLRLEVATDFAALVPRLGATAWIPACVEAAPPSRSRDLLASRVVDAWLTPVSPPPPDPQGALVGIDLAGGAADGAVLVLRRELADHPLCHQLLERLGSRGCGKSAQDAPVAANPSSNGSSVENESRMGWG